MRRNSREGRYAERVLVGVDDTGQDERIVLWLERRTGAVWVVGRAVNPQLRDSDPTKMCVRGRAPAAAASRPAGTVMVPASCDADGNFDPQRRQNGRGNAALAR